MASSPARPRRRVVLDGAVAVRWAVAASVTLFYSVVGFRLYANGRLGMDLAIFDQAGRSLSHFRPPISAMKSPGMNLWGDHFHPVIVLLAPAYWVWDDPRVLLVVQALCIGLTTAIVGGEAERLLGRTHGLIAALAVMLGLALSPGVQYAAVFDFHEVALGMPLMAFACRAIMREQWRASLVWGMVLLFVKEDMGPLVMGLALVVALRGARRVGAVLAAASVIWTLVVLKVVLPALSPTGHWLYEAVLPGPWAQAQNVYRAFLGPGPLAGTLFVLLACGAFLALRSTLPLALAPILLVRSASGEAAYGVLHNHYNLLPCVVLALAVVEGWARVGRPRLVSAVMIAVAMANLVFGPAIEQAADAPSTARRLAAGAAVAAVPDGASVAADAYLTPHLTRDHPITQQLRPPVEREGRLVFLDDIGRPLVARYRVLDTQTPSNGGDPSWVAPAIDVMRADGCTSVFEREGFVVLDCGPER